MFTPAGKEEKVVVVVVVVVVRESDKLRINAAVWRLRCTFICQNKSL